MNDVLPLAINEPFVRRVLAIMCNSPFGDLQDRLEPALRARKIIVRLVTSWLNQEINEFHISPPRDVEDARSGVRPQDRRRPVVLVKLSECARLNPPADCKLCQL